MTLARDGTEDQKEWAAAALKFMADDNAENQAAVARTGAIAPLCNLVKEGMTEDVKEQVHSHHTAESSLATRNGCAAL